MDNNELPLIKKKFKDSPVQNEYKNVMQFSGDPGYINRLLIATPTLGTVKMQWAVARFGQIVPTNWSAVFMNQFMGGYMPEGFLVADAQNLIVQQAIEKDMEWLLFVEDDVIIPPDCFVRLNNYIIRESHPIVSGLYFTKSVPSEPLIYRGRGNGPYYEWSRGDVVNCDGVPNGILLVHMGIMREMWKDAQEYRIPYGAQIVTRAVFVTPTRMAFDPETMQCNSTTGTSDLDWCTRVIEGDYIRKAGWTEYMDELEDKRYPLIVDTNIFCRHIAQDGRQYP